MAFYARSEEARHTHFVHKLALVRFIFLLIMFFLGHFADVNKLKLHSMNQKSRYFVRFFP